MADWLWLGQGEQCQGQRAVLVCLRIGGQDGFGCCGLKCLLCICSFTLSEGGPDGRVQPREEWSQAPT